MCWGAKPPIPLMWDPEGMRYMEQHWCFRFMSMRSLHSGETKGPLCTLVRLQHYELIRGALLLCNWCTFLEGTSYSTLSYTTKSGSVLMLWRKSSARCPKTWPAPVLVGPGGGLVAQPCLLCRAAGPGGPQDPPVWVI